MNDLLRCPKCKKGELIMTEIFYMAWFGCPKCNAVFHSDGYNLIEDNQK